jgi:hypothetical protein
VAWESFHALMYNKGMPVVPFLDIGLSPLLAIIVNPILSFILAYKIVK